MTIFIFSKPVETKEYYVWFDPILEELFSMEKDDLENHQVLKNQLLKEKVVFHLVEAKSWKNSFEVYRNTLSKNDEINIDDKDNHVTLH